MSLNLKDDILNAVRESKINRTCRCKTPKFRKPTVPPQYNPPPMPPVKKPKPNYTPPASEKPTCTYSTPCGWCTKWEKKCDRKIGRSNDTEPLKKKDAELEYIKSGKGMPDDKE